jgi:uncharacterized protein (TIGR02145 family)
MYMHTSRKSFLISLLFLVAVTFTQAQVGVGTTSPHASARFQVDANLSTQARGFLPPRLTIAERNAITSPATGLIIFNTTTNALNIYFSDAWYQLSSSLVPGSIATLVTASPTNNGTLKSGTAASGVSSIVSYTGGNGENHSGQTVTSTGVPGLTATLSAGGFALGNGTLTYNITGTPSSAGTASFATASFALNIGGQTNTLTRNVENTIEVMIGTQQWKTQNLNVEVYADGTVIPQVTDPSAWLNLTTGAWCWYNNDAANGAIYGKLYNWYAAAGIWNTASLTDATQRKNICPVGWHVPSDAEWTTLANSLGGLSVAGGKMKFIGSTLWANPNTGATNESGFTGLPGGLLAVTENFREFFDVGIQGFLWSSNEENTEDAYYSQLISNYESIILGYQPKKWGSSVRCIKN